MAKQFYEFTPDDSRDEIITHLQTRVKQVIGSEGRTPVGETDFVANYFIELLKLKLQKEILAEQNCHSKRMFIVQVILTAVAVGSLFLNIYLVGNQIAYQKFLIEGGIKEALKDSEFRENVIDKMEEVVKERLGL